MPHRLTAENTVTAETFISMAAKKSDAEMRETVKYISDVNGQDPSGNTPLIACAYWNMKETMKELVKVGADADIKNNDGYSAMIFASEYSDPEGVLILIKAGGDPNIANNEGWTPLMWACFFGHYETARALLEGGADINRKNSSMQSALNIARLRHLEAMESLLENHIMTKNCPVPIGIYDCPGNSGPEI